MVGGEGLSVYELNQSSGGCVMEHSGAQLEVNEAGQMSVELSRNSRELHGIRHVDGGTKVGPTLCC